MGNDFAALDLDHPLTMIRDTCRFRPLRIPGKEKMTPSLKRLAAHWLHINIQDGQHDSVKDARIALRLYRLKCSLWERMMRGAMRSGRQEDEEDVDSDDEGEPVDEEVEARKVEPLPVEKDGNLGKKARAQKGRGRLRALWLILRGPSMHLCQPQQGPNLVPKEKLGGTEASKWFIGSLFVADS